MAARNASSPMRTLASDRRVADDGVRHLPGADRDVVGAFRRVRDLKVHDPPIEL